MAATNVHDLFGDDDENVAAAATPPPEQPRDSPVKDEQHQQSDQDQDQNQPDDLFGDDDGQPNSGAEHPDGGEDLFGGSEHSEDEQERPASRQPEQEQQQFSTQLNLADRRKDKAGRRLELNRKPAPRETDGEVHVSRVVQTVAVDAAPFDDPSSFRDPSSAPPTKYDANGFPRKLSAEAAQKEAYMARQKALQTVRWRHAPSDPSILQSNTRLLRWSDGSLTVQLATAPGQQFLVPENTLALPDPRIDAEGNKIGDDDEDAEGFAYHISPATGVPVQSVINKITNPSRPGFSKQGGMDDEALERLEASLAAATQQRNRLDDHETVSGISYISMTEDPEAAKKRAEMAEREAVRAARKRENQEAREHERATGGGSTKSRNNRFYGGGLTVGGLEDDEDEEEVEEGEEDVATSDRRRQKHASGGSSGKRRPDAEDRRFATADEYEEDDFVVEDEDDEEEGDEGSSGDEGAHERRKKRSRVDEEDEGEDEDEDGLDAAEAALERQAAERKKNKSSRNKRGSGSEGEDENDVDEDEEDEGEQRKRRRVSQE